MPITLPMVKPRMLKHRLPPGKPGKPSNSQQWSAVNQWGRQTCLACYGQGTKGGKDCKVCLGEGYRWQP